MGFTPAQIGEMSLWEFNVVWGTWVKANSKDDTPSGVMTQDEIDAASAMIDSGPQRVM